MLTVAETIERLAAATRLLAVPESVPLADAGNRVLAQDLVSTVDVPPLANSAMDGYALRQADWPGQHEDMVISQRIAAGSVGTPLTPGTAARIFTGAPVPEGADTVVMQENTETQNQQHVRILKLADRGANIRPRGQDIAAGNVIIERGTRLRPQELGLIAGQGLPRIECYKKLRVGLLSSGDELIEPGEHAGVGQIYNSNRFTIAGLLKSWAFQCVDLGIAPDDPQAIRSMLQAGSERADVIVTSGGVSVGEEDHVRNVVESLGRIDQWKVLIKPGKPFAFGHIGKTPFIGLPGNPVSVFVTMVIIARGFLMDCQGVRDSAIVPLRAPALFDKPGDSREDYLRVRLTSEGIERFPVDSSGVLNSLCWSDGLVRQGVGQAITKGDMVDYFPYRFML